MRTTPRFALLVPCRNGARFLPRPDAVPVETVKTRGLRIDLAVVDKPEKIAAAGVEAWSAASSYQIAWDDDRKPAEERQGVFTAAYVAGHAQPSGDANTNGIVSLSELFEFVKKQSAAYCAVKEQCQALDPQLEVNNQQLGASVTKVEEAKVDVAKTDDTKTDDTKTDDKPAETPKVEEVKVDGTPQVRRRQEREGSCKQDRTPKRRCRRTMTASRRAERAKGWNSSSSGIPIIRWRTGHAPKSKSFTAWNRPYRCRKVSRFVILHKQPSAF